MGVGGEKEERNGGGLGSDLPQRVRVHSFTSAGKGSMDQSRSLGLGGKTCIVQ